MTDLVPPPEDPQGQLRWARRLLRQFPPGSGILGANAVLQPLGRHLVDGAGDRDPVLPLDRYARVSDRSELVERELLRLGMRGEMRGDGPLNGSWSSAHG